MNRIFLTALTVIALTGCADRYSLDKNRGPDPSNITTHNQLSLPPDFLLRAPEPALAPVPVPVPDKTAYNDKTAAMPVQKAGSDDVLSETVKVQQDESGSIPEIQKPDEETSSFGNISESDETVVESTETGDRSAASETVTETTETIEEE